MDYTELRQSTDPVLHGRYVEALEAENADLRARIAELETPAPPPEPEKAPPVFVPQPDAGPQ